MSEDMSKGPSKILAFDPLKQRAPEPVDLDTPFFKITRPEYPACDHRNRGVTLDTGRRVATCLCGEDIDCFDALLIYAHAQQRLVNTRAAIEEHHRKEAEKKAKKAFVRDVRGFTARLSRRGAIIGNVLSLECGHEQYWDKRKPPRRATCETCVRNEKFKTTGVTCTPTKSAP